MNLKIANHCAPTYKFDIFKLEQDLIEKTIEIEKKMVLEKLESVSDHYSSDILIFNGIRCKREIRSIEVSIGRVTVNWKRPIYVGSKEGKPVRFYPADESIKLPKKTKGSYQLLKNCALLSAFLPFDLAQKILALLLGKKVHGSTVKRYAETVGQFASENLEEILKGKKSALELGENEILLASVDGSSSLINGTRSKSNKRKKKNKRNYKKKVFKR